jgi:hypothetical protein
MVPNYNILYVIFKVKYRKPHYKGMTTSYINEYMLNVVNNIFIDVYRNE